jgi:putative membrane protein
MSALPEVGWSLYPSVLIGMALWTAGYLLVLREGHRAGRPAVSQWRQAAFHLGTLAGLLVLISPLDELGDEYLFSAHMTQHLLLMYVTASCWVLGFPGWLLDAASGGVLRRGVQTVLSPVAALIIFSGVMLVWHVPAIYGAAEDHEWIHITEHLTYIGAAMIGWWPILGPSTRLVPARSAPLRILYGFLVVMPGTLLGAVLAFAGTPLYEYYRTVPHPFGLTALADQQLAGLIMWIPTHMILLGYLAVIGARWLNREHAGHPRALE